MPEPKLRPTGVVDVDVELAHAWSIDHQEDLFASETCGCFYCLDVFPVEAINDWTDTVDGVGANDGSSSVCDSDGSAEAFAPQVICTIAYRRIDH